jgi:hypothetical protein
VVRFTFGQFKPDGRALDTQWTGGWHPEAIWTLREHKHPKPVMGIESSHVEACAPEKNCLVELKNMGIRTEVLRNTSKTV